jgi:hypothetical protein
MNVTATHFRKNLFQLLDDTAGSGLPLRINLKGRVFVLSPEETPSKLDLLGEQNLINGTSESLLNMDWSSEWSEKHI